MTHDRPTYKEHGQEALDRALTNALTGDGLPSLTTSYRVFDLESELGFWLDVFDFTLVFASDDAVVLREPNGRGVVAFETAPTRVTPDVVLRLTSDDLSASEAQLTRAGIAVTTVYLSASQRALKLKTPSGVEVEILGPYEQHCPCR